MSIFKDKTEMPSEPDLAVTSIKIKGERLSGAVYDMQMAGVRNWPERETQNLQRPRFGHKV